MTEKILKLSVQEAIETLLMSQSSIYSWIEKGKLKAEEHVTGRLIVISEKEAEEIRALNQKSRRNKISKQNFKNDDNLQENTVIDAEYYSNNEEMLTNSNNVMMNLVKRIEELAVDAGKYKQLEIIRKDEKDDLKNWQEKYFELQLEYKKLQEDFHKAEMELAELKARHKGIFSFFKKKD